MSTQLPVDHTWTSGPSCCDGPHLSQEHCLLRSTCPNSWNPWDVTAWGVLSTGLVPANDNSHPDLALVMLFWAGSFTPDSSIIPVYTDGRDRDPLAEARFPCLWHPLCLHRPMPVENLTLQAQRCKEWFFPALYTLIPGFQLPSDPFCLQPTEIMTFLYLKSHF